MSRLLSHIRRPYALLGIILFGLVFTACQSTPPAADEPTATVAPVATDPPAPTDTPSADSNAAASTQEDTNAEAAQAVSLMAMLQRAEGLEDFVSYAESSGLAEKLQDDALYTLFVTPNAAFDSLPEQVRNDADLMAQIMDEHLVEGAFLIQELIEAGGTPNVAGTDIVVMRGGTGGTVNGSNILGADFVGTNGVIHVLDTLLLPPAQQAEIMALYPSVAGEVTYVMQGNIHIEQGETSPVAYNSTPPTSGPHYPNIVAWQVYEEPFAYEQLIHNLEDSGVLIYYQCAEPCPALFQQLSDFAQPYIDAGRHVAVVPNDPSWTTAAGVHPHADMGAPIAVVAWQKLLKLDEFDGDKMAQFIEAYEGIDHHVK